MSGNISHDAVRALAHKLWQERGGVGGSAEEDWRRAEEILHEDSRATLHERLGDASAPAALSVRVEKLKANEVMDRAAEESFPASDPPAVHGADEPPVNAGAKWNAAVKDGAKRGSKRKGGGASL